MAVRTERGPLMQTPDDTVMSDRLHAQYWRTRGRYDAWVTYRRRDVQALVGWRFPPLDPVAMEVQSTLRFALYFGLPEDSASSRLVAKLQRMVNGDSVPAPGLGSLGIAHCWLSQWRLARGDTTGVDRAIAYVRELAALDAAGRFEGPATRARWVVCLALLEALAARVTGENDPRGFPPPSPLASSL